MKDPTEPLAVSLDKFTAMTGLGRTTAYNLIRSNRLTKIKVRGRTLICVASIHALLADSCQTGGETR